MSCVKMEENNIWKTEVRPHIDSSRSLSPSVYICVYMYISMYIYIYIYIYMYMYMCVCVCVYACIYIGYSPELGNVLVNPIYM